MSLPRGLAIQMCILVLIPLPVLATKGVGISGPDQIFTLTQGENLSSYIRIYNTGDEPTTYHLNLSGNASHLVSPRVDEIALEPDKNERLPLTYAVPASQAPGLYVGSILVSVKGQQISPGVSKEIKLTVLTRSDEEPTLKFLSPSEEIVSGDVDVVVEVWDPSVEVAILIDGKRVSSSSRYVWNTKKEKNGQHVLTAEASHEGNLTRSEITVEVDNPANGSIFWLAIPLIVFAVALLAGAYVRSRRHHGSGQGGN